MQEETAKTGKKGNTAILIAGIGAKTECIVSAGSKNERDSHNGAASALRRAVEKEFPDCEVREAFTGRRKSDVSETVLEIVLEKAASDGINNLVVQPMYLMKGYKYIDLVKFLENCKEKFSRVAVGAPLLSEDADFTATARAITERTAKYDDGETAVCFVGHGTAAASHIVYWKMQEALRVAGHENYYIGTIKEKPISGDVAAILREKSTYKRVVLAPLMITAGLHAWGDIAGEGADSWKSILRREGYSVEYIPEGLGEIPAVRDLYVEHVRQAVTAISSGNLWG